MAHKNTVNCYSFFCLCILFFNSECSKIHQPYKKAEDFLVYDLNGNRFYLSAQKGTIVLLNFWSVQCAPCIKEMPELEQMAQDFLNKNVMVVGICMKPFEKTLINTIIQKTKISYSNCIDENNQIADIYRVTMLPTTYIIDYNGFIRYQAVAYQKENIDTFKTIISQLINERDAKKQ